MTTHPGPRYDDPEYAPDPLGDPSAYPVQGTDTEVRPVNWLTLDADDARAEFLDLNRWVDWLRRAYGIPPTIVPPLWHRHDELIWELSALHTHWRNSYDPDASPSAPLAWHRDFAEARHRLREWVATCGTRLDRDRPTRHTAWPGEPATEPAPESPISDREADFVAFLIEDLRSRLPRWPGAEHEPLDREP